MKSFLLSLSLILFTTSITHARALSVTVCYPLISHPPYFLGQGIKIPPKGQRGSIVNAIDEAASQNDINVNWIRLPWKRCLVQLFAGEIDSVATSVYRPQWEPNVVFPSKSDGNLDENRSVGQANYHYYQHKQYSMDRVNTDILSRHPLRIGSPRGYAVTDLLKNNGMKIIENLDPIKGFQRVFNGQLDRYVFGEEMVKPILDDMGEAGASIMRVDPPILTTHVYIPLHAYTYAQDAKRFEKFWTDLASIRKNQVLP